jgi:uncharacterized membrane protein
MDHLLDSAFEQIRLYAQLDIAVSLRLLRAMIDISSTMPDVTDRQALVERGARVVNGCAENLGEAEIGELRTRQKTLERLAEPSYS